MKVRNKPIHKTGGLYPEPLARFVRSVDAARQAPEDEAALVSAVDDALARLVGERDWLRPEHRRGWTDRYRQHVLHVAPTVASAWSRWCGAPDRRHPSTTT